MPETAVPVSLSEKVRSHPRPLAPGPVLVERHTVSDAWAINTYNACDIRCTYCITQAQGTSTPRYPSSDIARRLRDELDRVEIDRLVVGPYCDVYPGPEAELGVTRAALEALAERDLGFMLITKGTTVVRDADLLRHRRTLVQISISSLDEETLARLEPGAAPPTERLRALERLAALGIRVLVQATPWIPGLTDLVALRAAVDPAIDITTAPMRTPQYLQRAKRALPFTQEQINDAYRREYERLAGIVDVKWSRVPPADGTAPHINDNFGRRVLPTLASAPTARDPGPNPWEE